MKATLVIFFKKRDEVKLFHTVQSFRSKNQQNNLGKQLLNG